MIFAHDVSAVRFAALSSPCSFAIIIVQLSALRSDAGMVRCSLYDNADAFPES